MFMTSNKNKNFTNAKKIYGLGIDGTVYEYELSNIL
ncbi:hypothetical protein CCAND93_170030 [Capnocytophaga canis]|uniref:Uncharacterized protein n=1 Tax=Capnocytophaga canis TaxID=1848903 RepID=A0A0B7INH9_9FLAO|nr:hypothetical protein CCAND93_170030 [Capnocytophaga canis]